jgi:regulator of replication initiation timing
MSEMTEIVDNLENRISKLLHKFEIMKQANESLQEELTSVKTEYQKLEGDLQLSKDQVQTLKAANAMLGSTDHKRETKLKINSLIREIDQCIVQLSE